MKPLRYLTIKIFAPGNRQHRTRVIKCPKGHHIMLGEEKEVLKTITAELRKQSPDHDYEVKEVGRGAYNFVWVAQKPVPDEELLVGGMRLGEVTSVEVGT